MSIWSKFCFESDVRRRASGAFLWWETRLRWREMEDALLVEAEKLLVKSEGAVLFRSTIELKSYVETITKMPYRKLITILLVLCLSLQIAAVIVPIDWHHKEGFFRDQFMLYLLSITMIVFIYALYHFSVKSPITKNRNIWFLLFVVFNIFTAYIYFIYINYLKNKDWVQKIVRFNQNNLSWWS